MAQATEARLDSPGHPLTYHNILDNRPSHASRPRARTVFQAIRIGADRRASDPPATSSRCGETSGALIEIGRGGGRTPRRAPCAGAELIRPAYRSGGHGRAPGAHGETCTSQQHCTFGRCRWRYASSDDGNAPDTRRNAPVPSPLARPGALQKRAAVKVSLPSRCADWRRERAERRACLRKARLLFQSRR